MFEKSLRPSQFQIIKVGSFKIKNPDSVEIKF